MYLYHLIRLNNTSRKGQCFMHLETSGHDQKPGCDSRVCISTSHDHRSTPCPVAAIHTIFKLAKRDYCGQLVCVSVCMCVSVCPLWCNTWIHGGGRGRWSG